MWRLYARKVNILNGGGPANAIGCNIADDGVLTAKRGKSAEVIVTTRESGEGPNKRIFE